MEGENHHDLPVRQTSAADWWRAHAQRARKTCHYKDLGGGERFAKTQQYTINVGDGKGRKLP